MKSKLTTALLAAAVVVATIGVVPVSGSASNAASAKHGSPTNFTITVSDHTPGKQDVTMSAYAAKSDIDQGMRPMGNLTVFFPSQLGVKDCQITEARAAGIDKKNDDPGTKTDESFVGRYSKRTRSLDSQPKYSNYNFYSKDAFEGESINLNPDDQIVARLANCWDNPSKKGWYRWNGYINGTTSNGNFIETNAYSHWYYICDCDSYDQAVNTLGSPPSSEGQESDDGKPGSPVNKDYKFYAAGSSGGGGGGGGSTATATATSGGGGGGGSASTATATATSGGDGGGSGAPTATSTTSGDSAGTSPTAGGAGVTSPTSAGTGVGTATSTGGANGTAAGTPAGTTAGGATNSAVATTTSHSGPGFGVAAALLALLAAALVAVRRR